MVLSVASRRKEPGSMYVWVCVHVHVCVIHTYIHTYMYMCMPLMQLHIDMK